MKKYKYFIIIIIICVLFFKLSNKKEDNVIYVNYYEKMINDLYFNKDDLKNNNTDEIKNENTYLNIINNIRSQYGLSNMNLNYSLDNSTKIRAIEISTFFDHIRPNGMDYDSVIDYYNSCSGENIAVGYNSVDDVINAWMNSPGHRDNILNPSFKFFSISSYNHNGMIYWDMLFSC